MGLPATPFSLDEHRFEPRGSFVFAAQETRGDRWENHHRQQPGGHQGGTVTGVIRRRDWPMAVAVTMRSSCRLGDLAHWLGPELWLMELAGETLAAADSLVARRGRLLERVDGWSGGVAGSSPRAAPSGRSPWLLRRRRRPNGPVTTLPMRLMGQ
jgi:hypothetical protein